MDITLNLVDIPKNDKGYYEYDFYPNRKFKGVEYCILFRKESWGNLEYICKFLDRDSKNIQLICFTSYNLFPICSFICHKCILMEDSFILAKRDHFTMNNISKEKFIQCCSISKPEYIFDMTDKRQRNTTKNNRLNDMWDFGQKYTSSPVYITKESYEKFNKCKMFSNNMTIVVYKHTDYRYVIEKLYNDGIVFEGKDYVFLKKILEYSGPNSFLSFQLLSSLYYGVGYFGYGGSASLLALCLPINCVFLSDNCANVSECIIVMKGHYNKMLYGVLTNGFIHIRGNPDYALDVGWRYECVKESINNNKNCKIPTVTVNDLTV